MSQRSSRRDEQVLSSAVQAQGNNEVVGADLAVPAEEDDEAVNVDPVAPAQEHNDAPNAGNAPGASNHQQEPLMERPPMEPVIQGGPAMPKFRVRVLTSAEIEALQASVWGLEQQLLRREERCRVCDAQFPDEAQEVG